MVRRSLKGPDMDGLNRNSTSLERYGRITPREREFTTRSYEESVFDLVMR